jgi:hypothetical protein
MARIGAFDRHLEPLAWWEAELIPAGWYVDELLVEPVAGVTGTLTATLGSATLSATGTGPTTSSAIVIPSSNNPSYRSGFYSPRRGGTPKYPSLWDGCVGAWAPSLGATGLTLRDESVYGNHGTLTNMDAASDWVVSGGKGALDFDGTDDRVTTTLKIGSWNAISYVIWVRPRITGQFQALVTNWNSDGEVFELFISNASDFVGSSFPFGVSFAATDNIWQHVALTRGSDTRLYVNGILQGTIANQSPISSIQNLTFGDRPTGGSYPLNGQMDDIRVYDRVLTPSEIRTLATRRGIAYESRRRLAVRSGAASPSGTLAKTLDGATLSSSGTLTAGASGTVTSTLDAATLASTGTVGSGVTATVSVTLAAATLSASGTLASGLSGTVTRTLDNASLSSSGTVAAGASGTVTRTLDNATLSATGGAAGSVTGSVSSTLAAVTCSATGTLAAGLSGSVNRTLADVVSSATGTLAAGASGSVTRTLADATLSSTGSFSAGLTASVNRALDSCVVSSTGTVANGATGSLSVQLASATLQSGNVALGGFRLKVAGEWKDAMAFVKVTGTWKSATPFVKVGGVWE